MSKTTYGGTKSAILNDCFTSANLAQVARLATLYQVVHGVAGMGMLLAKEPDRLVTHDMHDRFGWSHNGTGSVKNESLDRPGIARAPH